MPADDGDLEVSLVRGDALFRLQRALGLIPAHGLGVVRRATLAGLVTWAPLAVAAAAADRFWPGAAAEPLAHQFGVHARFLVAVPVLILGEALVHAVECRVVPHFVRSGLVADDVRPDFTAVLRRTAAAREGWRPWAVVAVLVAVSAVAGLERSSHELRWALPGPTPSIALRFGTFWFHFVSRPIFIALLLIWLWRMGLATLLMWRIARLPLALVPTHPDRAGGLGFTGLLPASFASVTFAVAAVLSAQWTHEALYHGMPLGAVLMPLGTLVTLAALLLLAPLAAFLRPLMVARRRALLDYGALVAEHHRLVQRRWLFGEPVQEAPMLHAPELGPVADTVSLYQAVMRMRPLPVDRWLLAAIAVPVAVPLLPLIAVEVPVSDALLMLLRMLL